MKKRPNNHGGLGASMAARPVSETGPVLDELTLNVLAHLATGMSMAEAADAAGLTNQQASKRVRRARAALELPTTIQVIVDALRQDLI